MKPSTKNNQPDHDLMQTIISAAWKSVIKGGVEYMEGVGR